MQPPCYVIQHPGAYFLSNSCCQTIGKYIGALYKIESKDCAAIGKYAAENGNTAATTKFKTAYGVGESTVQSFKKYLEELKKLPKPGTSTEVVEIKTLQMQKRGGKVLLGKELDSKVQSYIRALHSAGNPIGFHVVVAAGKG